ncbi:hypothetical protein BKA67DRAFT_571374 [Truncatella angustata]|uniref:Uncharacterized protein n=1 Tax=Truncatella angustata TaxID=152316 RepID=A0A9P8UG29_9PEZI|nr:uncharacterized protein BKA67DRAFT_571374 [Truncatella angustata]KAH6651622.1 hypothetical protein BKA67DRAFT_571374 [Truncatella angustata]
MRLHVRKTHCRRRPFLLVSLLVFYIALNTKEFSARVGYRERDADTHVALRLRGVK